MRVCMVSPHLPPEQSANALLPAMLGDALAPRGVDLEFVSHPSVGGGASNGVRRIVYVPRRAGDRLSRTRPGAVIAGARMAFGARRTIRSSDLVHLHGNGFIIEIGQWLAKRYRKPYVITLYGTDISAYDADRNARFGRVVRGAACRVFYSHGLLEQARRAGLAPDPSTVIYAPVGAAFAPDDEQSRGSIRRDLGLADEPLLLTVKRLHPVAGHDTLLDAFAAVVREMPEARLWLAGDGELRPALERRSHELGIDSRVRFLGRVDNEVLRRYYGAADLFVLPSRVESWGTVMLESLSCGTPVVTTDTMGGLEVRGHFPADVQVVQTGSPGELATALLAGLRRRFRTGSATLERIRTSFSVPACAEQYLDVYARSGGSRRP